VHRFPAGDPVENTPIDGLPARKRAVAAATRGLLCVGAGLEQAVNPAPGVVDCGKDGMIAVNPIASTSSFIPGLRFVAAMIAFAPGLGIL
jgi:hypothetical protein